MGCKNAVLAVPKKTIINCLTFEENTSQPYKDNLCLFRALALHSHENWKLEEETSKNFNLSIYWMKGLSPSQFKGVHMNEIPIVDVLIFSKLYGIDFVEGNIIGELTWQSVQEDKTTLRLLRYNNHI